MNQTNKIQDLAKSRLIETPLPLLSTSLKEIFSSYETQIQCSCAILSDNVLRRQKVF